MTKPLIAIDPVATISIQNDHSGKSPLLLRCSFVAVLILLAPSGAPCADINAAVGLFNSGQYSKCYEMVNKAIEEEPYSYGEQWRILLIESMLSVGQYDQATKDINNTLRSHRRSIPLLLLAHKVYQRTGQTENALEMLTNIWRQGSSFSVRQWNSTDLVALGKAALLLGGEPRIILEDFYQRALEMNPDCRQGYLEAGRLALDKHDFALAAEHFQKAVKRYSTDPDMHYGLAMAYFHSDRTQMLLSLETALSLNPNHTDSLLLLAEHQIDSEDYPGSNLTLDQALTVNPKHPSVWAFKAVLAHLANDPNRVTEYRSRGLESWSRNPQVDYLIGKKISQKYRFAEGASYQRQVLVLDPYHLPAKIQLAQDLLRLGEQEEGWTLADEVHAQDGYDITAYNLVTLRDSLSKFKTLRTKGFIVRMEKLEAALYGDRVLHILQQAQETLCKKYGLKPTQAITVEIFPDQNDFAVRTFGMPGGQGYLGVCFGNVITANSPKLTMPINWQSVLWHEYCHVVTLNMTRNKIPRWLSEGISVYEETRRNPTWGQKMTPQYRRMILEGELTPVSKLSGAFLNPPSPDHLQFAYFESSMVVAFLMEQFGDGALKKILIDLGQGIPIHQALSSHTMPIKKFEKEFEQFIRQQANALAPKMDWGQPTAEEVNPSQPVTISTWLEDHPNSFSALTLQAKIFMSDRRWEDAKKPLKKLIELYPQQSGPDNPYQWLAQCHRHLDEATQEHEVLEKLVRLSSNAFDAYERLTEIAMEQKNWQSVIDHTRRTLGVYPLLPRTYLRSGQAYESLGLVDEAIDSYQRLLMLDSSDPAEINYRLALLWQNKDPVKAKRHVLTALSKAPRYRDAHRLLQKIVAKKPGDTTPDQEATQ